MKGKIIMLGILALVPIIVVMGCVPEAPAPPLAQTMAVTYPMSVKDDAQRTVEIKKPVSRIVSLAPSNTEILFALGLGDLVVGVDQYSDYPVEAKAKERVGGYTNPDMERVVSLSPDLLLATSVHAKTVVPQLESRGFTVIVLQPKDVDAILDNIRLVAKITNRVSEAESLTSILKRRIDQIVAKGAKASKKPRVFFELSPQLSTAGPGSFIDDLIKRVGGENIAADAQVEWPKLSQEVLVAKDPEVILLGDHTAGETPDKVKARPGWDKLSAVRNNRVHTIDPNLTNRPGPRVVDGLEVIARALYPEQFP